VAAGRMGEAAIKYPPEVYGTPPRAPMLKAALDYAARGWPVFPIKPGRKEPPLIKDWPNKATTDPRQIHMWWNRWPGANIAVATGEQSGILAVDVDNYASLAVLEAEHDTLPATRTHVTPSRGMHYLYRYPAGEDIRCNTSKIAKGIDVRGEGGYIIAPPSQTTFPYEVLDELPLADSPPWLLEALRESQGGPTDAALPQSYAPWTGGEIPEGTRDDTLFRHGSKLRAQGYDHAAIIDELLRINAAYCAPPLPESQVRVKARQAARYAPGNLAPDVTPEALEMIAAVKAKLERAGWHGVGDHTDHDLMVAVCRIALRQGRVIPAGVRIEASIRELAEEAAIGSTRTVWKSIKRLRSAGWLRRDGTRTGPNRGALVLLRAGGNTRVLCRDKNPPSGESVSPGAPPLSAPRLRWSAPGRAGRLNKIRGRIIDVLEAAGPLDAEELADALASEPPHGKRPRPRDLRRRDLPKLIEAQVVECVGGEYRLVAGWREALDARREQDGEIEDAERQKRQHRDQQERFREAWQRGEVLSKQELARRQRNRDRIRPDERHVSGTVEELETVLVAEPELVKALAAALVRWPDHLGDYPSWWASTLYCEDYLPYRPALEQVESALAELTEGVAA
jgi:hypothetical protein